MREGKREENTGWGGGSGGEERKKKFFLFVGKTTAKKLTLCSSLPLFLFSSFLTINKKQQQYGRDDPVRIASEVEGKTEAEVASYLETFKQRFAEVHDHERLLRNIQKGEERLARHAEVAGLIRAKLAQYKNPWSELRLSYGEWRGSGVEGGGL